MSQQHPLPKVTLVDRLTDPTTTSDAFLTLECDGDTIRFEQEEIRAAFLASVRRQDFRLAKQTICLYLCLHHDNPDGVSWLLSDLVIIAVEETFHDSLCFWYAYRLWEKMLPSEHRPDIDTMRDEILGIVHYMCSHGTNQTPKWTRSVFPAAETFQIDTEKTPITYAYSASVEAIETADDAQEFYDILRDISGGRVVTNAMINFSYRHWDTMSNNCFENTEQHALFLRAIVCKLAEGTKEQFLEHQYPTPIAPELEVEPTQPFPEYVYEDVAAVVPHIVNPVVVDSIVAKYACVYYVNEGIDEDTAMFMYGYIKGENTWYPEPTWCVDTNNPTNCTYFYGDKLHKLYTDKKNAEYAHRCYASLDQCGLPCPESMNLTNQEFTREFFEKLASPQFGGSQVRSWTRKFVDNGPAWVLSTRAISNTRKFCVKRDLPALMPQFIRCLVHRRVVSATTNNLEYLLVSGEGDQRQIYSVGFLHSPKPGSVVPEQLPTRIKELCWKYVKEKQGELLEFKASVNW